MSTGEADGIEAKYMLDRAIAASSYEAAREGSSPIFDINRARADRANAVVSLELKPATEPFAVGIPHEPELAV